MVINLGPSHTHPLSPMKFGKAFGFLYGVWLLSYGVVAWQFGYGTQIVSMLADIFPGISMSPTGIAALTGWGALQGFVFGYLLAWLYNKM